jgi:GNAT superfamily N-acetyltransferase
MPVTPSSPPPHFAVTSLPKFSDRFDEWFHAPLPYESSDPRFEVRRAGPSEYPAIYDLVDAGFGFERPREVYDWLYRRNPRGPARCWVVVEKASGRIVSQSTDWPWPIARGAQALEGFQVGDTVTAPRWQRHGIGELLGEARAQHPFEENRISLGWPNEKTIGRMRKHGREWKIMGPLPQAVCRLGRRSMLRTAVGAALGAGARTLFGRRSGIVVEEIRRFDSAFDDVTAQHAAWHGFWCPHDFELLNWRHLDRPTSQHVALSLSHHGSLAGYCVLKLQERSALLMDFVAPREPPSLSVALLRRALGVAREAGCTRLRFFATPAWPHWPLFRACKFAERPSNVFILSLSRYRPEGQQIERWQCLPCDSDAL